MTSAFACVFATMTVGGMGGVPAAAMPIRADAAPAPDPVVDTVTAVVDDGDWLRWPLDGAVTGVFGEPRGGHLHEGIDIPVPAGTPIRAAAGGTVVMREWQDGYGKYTCIRHVAVLSCYAHQKRFHVKLDDSVEQGEVIGYTGDTGTSEAPHLHFEVRRGRRPWTKPVNPMRYLPPEPDRMP
jgi:murein DD-endopeptidase MepM/ murein hydrolase activator NlpD